MDSVERDIRLFTKSRHLVSLLAGEWVKLHDEFGEELIGIRGRPGAAEVGVGGMEVGVDIIEMDKGTAFPLHTHEGDHILYIHKGRVDVVIDGTANLAVEGDTVFIPAEYPHGVASPYCQSRFRAFGHPHKHIGDSARMKYADDS